jgi:uncharacterized membrane protein
MSAPTASDSTHPRHGWHWSARLSSLQRQGLALTVAVLAGAATRVGTHSSGELPWLAGWLGYCLAYLVMAWRLAAHLDAAATRRRAQWIDPGARALFFLVATAACASIAAVALAVSSSHGLQGAARWLHLGLAMAALAGSWLLLQTVFALHYAWGYYRTDRPGADPVEGLEFPGERAPDYLDFFYFSAVIGMTSQVSDVTVHSRAMRRLVLVHGLLSFFYNLVVLALAINVCASSLG